MPKRKETPELVDLSALPREALIRLPDVLRLFPAGRTTFLRGVDEGLYPQPVHIGKRSVAWNYGAIVDLCQTGVGPAA